MSDYEDIADAIDYLASQPAGDEWYVKQEIAAIAKDSARQMAARGFPVPQIFTHGPNSVVFTWDRLGTDYYLTVAEGLFAALISRSEAGQSRLDDMSLAPCLEMLSQMSN